MSNITKQPYLPPAVSVYLFEVQQGFAGSNEPEPQILIFRDDDHPTETYNTRNADGSTHYFNW